MARLVKDFDMECMDGNYIVKKEIGYGYPAVTVYDNRTGNEGEYYGIFTQAIQKIRKNKDCYILYI